MSSENRSSRHLVQIPTQFSFVYGGVFLLATTICVYAGVFRNGFVDFDDNVYVTTNQFTAAGISPASLAYAWTSFDSGNWIPMTWMSYQLDVSLFGKHAWAFHLTNLILHSANVLLLYWWLLRVTGFFWRCIIVSTLFAVHPLHVESVAWIAERKDVLSTFWLLITLLAYERYTASFTRSR